MNNNQSPERAIREVIFRNAETLTNRLLQRLADLATHVSKEEDRAAIGALSGTEADIERIRSLMVLARDCFPTANSKEES